METESCWGRTFVKKVWHEEHTEAEDNDERDLGVGE
jgi:hypothetical protein